MSQKITNISLCAGIGGIDRGLERGCPAVTTACYVERDAYACAVLRSRIREGDLADAPIWSDLLTFDAKPWRGVVDLVSGGFPCQPWSASGTRGKTEDERWLWPAIAGILRDCEPRQAVFLENVPGLANGGIHHVLWDLAQEGFDAEWGVYRALDVGATHRRPRIFILAYRSAELDGLLRATFGEGDLGALPSRVADRRDYGRTVRSEAHDENGCDASGDHVDGRHADIPGGSPSQPGPGFPPPPRAQARWERYFTAGGPLPAIRRGADGVPHRMDRLRVLGNAVVPEVIAQAWRDLLLQAYHTRAEHG